MIRELEGAGNPRTADVPHEKFTLIHKASTAFTAIFFRGPSA